jgi:chromosome segregation ATPase
MKNYSSNDNLNKSSYVPLQTFQSILVTEQNSDIDSLVKYLNERLSIYEENINSSYINIRNVIHKLEEEFPQVDINNFSDFFLICEEYYSLFETSKNAVEKLEELNKDKEKLEIKVDKLKSKKISLSSANQNLSEEIKFKDSIIMKLEDDLSNITKEYMDLSQKLNKNENHFSEALKQLNSPNHNIIAEITVLNDEKANLQRENLVLLNNLEKLEHEIRSKFFIIYLYYMVQILNTSINLLIFF